MLLFTIISELLPGDSAPMMALSVTHVNDKVLHFSAYAMVSFIPAFGLRLTPALGYLVTTELVGIALEFAQRFVRQRSYDPYDVAANTAGVFTGIVIAVAARTRFLRH
jgi:VanZ family protein